jgi:hypothetical protein
VFGSVTSGESNDISDIGFLIENGSAFGGGVDQYRVHQLLGIIPSFTLPRVEVRDFIKPVQTEAVAL